MGLTVYGGGGKPEEEKTVTAGTSVIEVLPSSGKTMKKVNVNPTPTEEKTITAGTSATTVTPTSGKYIKKVTVNPTPSQSKTVTPSTSQQTVSPDSGKLLSQVIVKAMEDVTPEVTAQTPVITQIAENLGVTITTPSGTNKQILQGNNANLLNIKNNAKKEGVYVWKKLTAEGGTFVDYVVDNNESKYPDGGTQGGYWYERMKEGITPEMFGCTKMAIDNVTYSSDQSGDRWDGLRVNHSLGTVPKFSILLANGNVPEIENYIKFSITTFPNANKGGSLSIGYSEYYGWCSEGFISVSADQQPTPTDTYAEFKPGSMFLGILRLKAGIEYTLITMA